MYLFAAVIMLAFTACGGGATETKTENVITACGDECQKACCLGCKAIEGSKKCIILEDGSMPCCISNDGQSEKEGHEDDELYDNKH